MIQKTILTTGLILTLLLLPPGCKTTGSGTSSPASLGEKTVAYILKKASHDDADSIFFTEKDYSSLRKAVAANKETPGYISRKYTNDAEFTVLAFNDLKPGIISCRNQWMFIIGTYTKGVKSIKIHSTGEISRKTAKNGITEVIINIKFTKIKDKEETGGEINLSAWQFDGGYQIKKIDIIR